MIVTTELQFDTSIFYYKTPSENKMVNFVLEKKRGIGVKERGIMLEKVEGLFPRQFLYVEKKKKCRRSLRRNCCIRVRWAIKDMIRSQ